MDLKWENISVQESIFCCLSFQLGATDSGCLGRCLGRCCPLHTFKLNAFLRFNWAYIIYLDAIIPQFKSHTIINRKENINEINNQWGQAQAQRTRLSNRLSNPTTAKLFRNCSCLQMSTERQELLSQMTNASLFRILLLEISFEDTNFCQ